MFFLQEVTFCFFTAPQSNLTEKKYNLQIRTRVNLQIVAIITEVHSFLCSLCVYPASLTYRAGQRPYPTMLKKEKNICVSALCPLQNVMGSSVAHAPALHQFS